MSSSPPRVSILIPNYNNGRASSRSGDVDLIGDLLQSLHDTLIDDPTQLEVIVCDDGSTDDSLDTCRAWSKRTWGGWRGGQPFLRLIEREHCGVLAVTANILTRESRGEFCVRLDGDITCSTECWAESLVRVFEEGPRDLGVVGPKQLGVDGRIHAAGDWILHPRGQHHIASGAPRDAINCAIECDHVMGCFYCHRRRVFDDVGGYDERYLRGQTVDFGLMARLKGWRAFSVPHIEFVHRHALRKPRSTRADTGDGIDYTLDVFEQKWGFNRLAPDLDRVRSRYAGTALLWNARVFGPQNFWPELASGRIDVAESEWGRYAQGDGARGLIDSRRMIAREIIRHLPKRERIAHFFCRGGLLTHLLAKDGHAMVGVDPDARLIDLAREVTARETYSYAPEFAAMSDRRTTPLGEQSVDAVLLFDAIERHANPVALFHEAHRVLRSGGVLAIVTPARSGPFDGDNDRLHCYRRHELKLQLEGTWKFTEFGKASDATTGNLIIFLAQAVRLPRKNAAPDAIAESVAEPKLPLTAASA